MWDIHGKMYLDTMSGSAGPAMVGHAHPAVAEAVAQQMAKLPSVNLLHDSPPLIEFCARMATIAPKGMTKTFLCTGGGEAVEAAIKFAIRVTGRAEVLSLVRRVSRAVAGHDGTGRDAGVAQVDAGRQCAGRISGRFLLATPTGRC